MTKIKGNTLYPLGQQLFGAAPKADFQEPSPGQGDSEISERSESQRQSSN